MKVCSTPATQRSPYNLRHLTDHPDPALVERDAFRPARGDDAVMEASGLQKRACRSNGCTCLKGTKRGQYCWNAYNSAKGAFYVQKAGSGHKSNDIYECNPQGGCCDYGPADKC
jgi:hypothetical protein